jgi:hypothetical protein
MTFENDKFYDIEILGSSSLMLNKYVNEMKNFNWIQGSLPILKYKYLCVDNTKRLRALRRILLR